MPFQKQDKGFAAWIPPTKEEKEEFDKSLLIKDEVNSDFYHSTQDYLNFFLKETLLGAQRLSSSNSNLLKGISNIAKKRFGIVDVIIPVYGHMQVLKPCLDSVLNRTHWPFTLTLVDDCSDTKTVKWLQKLQKSEVGCKVLFNKKNRGFAASVNRGIRETSNSYICVLNSDVIVTENWLTKMMIALSSDPKNKIVNPVTNNTAEISVPMQPGYSYIDMNRGLEATSSHKYPEIMPTGFCFLFPRELIEKLGYLDEGYYSYGEETDYWMRVLTHLENGEYPRWRAVLADDTYIYHERGTSFSSLGEGEHFSKRKSGNMRFKSIWPFYKDWRANFDVEKTLASTKATIPDSLIKNFNSRYDVAFVVHSAAYCGAMKYISDIVNAMNERNINAKIVVIKRTPTDKESFIGELRTSPVFFDTVTDALKSWKEKVFEKGFIVAATNELVPIVSAITKSSNTYKSVLFSQSADPLIAANEETKKSMEKAYGMVDYIISASEWLNKFIESKGYKTIGWVCPGLDKDLFYPRGRENGDDRPTFLFTIDHRYPYRGSDRGVELASALKELSLRNKIEVRILAYGADVIRGHQYITCLGKLSQSRIAEILGKEVDVFCDPSTLHSYGLPCLEAIASGVATVAWDNKGIKEYARNKSNALILSEKTSPTTAANEIFKLLINEKERNKLTNNKTIAEVYSRQESISKFIEIFEKGLDLYNPARKISVITPHLRKHGGPSTIIHMANKLKEIGHEVDLYTVYSDVNSELVSLAEVPLRLDWNNIQPSDILITNSDNDKNNIFNSLPQVKKKILLKLSHNPRFQQLENESLKMPWDSIITSTDWLKNICEKPSSGKGWSYSPQKATRIGWYHYGHSQFSKKYSDKPKSPVTTIGTLIHQHPLKGTEIALKALSAVKKKFPEDVHIVGFGEWPDFDYNKYPWIQYLFQLNREKIATAFSQVDIWVSASLSEGLGRMSLEAMSSSCAVVATDTGAEFVEENKNCLIVPPRNPKAIEDAVEKLFDVDLRKSIAEAGYETAEKFSNPYEYLIKLNNIIQGLFNE